MTQLEATQKIIRIRQTKTTDQELAEIIGITKKTLYKRIKLMDNWKKSELILIKQIDENEHTR